MLVLFYIFLSANKFNRKTKTNNMFVSLIILSAAQPCQWDLRGQCTPSELLVHLSNIGLGGVVVSDHFCNFQNLRTHIHTNFTRVWSAIHWRGKARVWPSLSRSFFLSPITTICHFSCDQEIHLRIKLSTQIIFSYFRYLHLYGHFTPPLPVSYTLFKIMSRTASFPGDLLLLMCECFL